MALAIDRAVRESQVVHDAKRQPEFAEPTSDVKNWENVIIFNEITGTVYVDAAPRTELQKNLDHRSRFYANPMKDIAVGIILVSVLIAVPLAGMFLLAGFPAEMAVVLAVIVGPVLGMLPGFYFGKWIAPSPIWIMRMFIGLCDEDTCEVMHGGHSRWESIIHRRFTESEWETREQEHDGETFEVIVPQIYRASTTHRMSLAKDAAHEYKSGDSKFEKIELALTAMIAIAAVGMLMLFGIVMMDAN